MAKKRETKKERFERIHRESENLPIVRALRERAEYHRAKLEAEGKPAPPAQP
jgi:hypothetical protein